MNRWTCFGLLLVALHMNGVSTTSAQETVDQTDALSSEYFPMGKGYKWVYDYEGQDVIFEVTRVKGQPKQPI